MFNVIIFLIFMIIVNVILFIFLTYTLYKFRSAQNLMKNFGVDLNKIDFSFWNNYRVGDIEDVKKDTES